MSVTTSLRNFEDRARTWLHDHAVGPYARVWLSIISFFEASVLPLPPSAFMIPMVAFGKRHPWMQLALLTTLTSVLGGLFGYFIGAVFYDTVGQWIIAQYNLADDISRLGELFTEHAFMANLIGAFTPIPYKALTLGSGFFSINIITFTVASVLGRGLRFFIVAYLAKMFGERFTHGVFRYVAFITLLAVVILIGVSVVGSL